VVPDAVVMDKDELDPALTLDGVKVATAPVGRPLAERATDWATPLVTAVEMVLMADEPAVTVAEVGESEMEKSLVGGGTEAPALKVAMPDDQYMDDPKLPEKAWAPGLARTWTPVMTVAMLVPVVVCWGWLV
jgi:hypothetical protein